MVFALPSFGPAHGLHSMGTWASRKWLLQLLLILAAASLLGKALQWEAGDADASAGKKGCPPSPSIVERGISSLICFALDVKGA